MNTGRYLLSLLLLSLVSATSALAQVQTGSFTVTYEEPQSGINRRIEMWVPGDYDATRLYPALLAWHGNGMPASMMRSILMPGAETIDAILVCPEYGGMNGDQINIMLNAALQYLSSTYAVDNTKVISTGFSMGGGLAYQIGLQVPQIFRGVIGISPAIRSSDFTSAMWSNLPNTRVATILGTEDFAFHEVDDLMTEIEERDGTLLYLKKEGVEHADQVYFTSQEFHDDFRACYEFIVGNVAAVPTEATSLDIAIHPNPASGSTIVTLPRAHAGARLDVVDMRGTVVRSIDVPAGVARQTIDAGSLVDGVYSVVVTVDGGRGVRRLVVTE